MTRIKYRWIYSEGNGDWEYTEYTGKYDYKLIEDFMKEIEYETYGPDEDGNESYAYKAGDRWSSFEWHIIPEWQTDHE